MRGSKTFSAQVVGIVFASLAIASDRNSINALIPELSQGTGVFYPNDTNWVNETVQRWTAFDEPTFFASVKPAEVSDLQTIVSLVPIFSCAGEYLEY